MKKAGKIVMVKVVLREFDPSKQSFSVIYTV